LLAAYTGAHAAVLTLYVPNKIKSDKYWFQYNVADYGLTKVTAERDLGRVRNLRCYALPQPPFYKLMALCTECGAAKQGKKRRTNKSITHFGPC